MIGTYDPKSVFINYGGVSIKDGIADGTFISISRTVRTRSLRVGSDGGSTIQVDPNRSATIQITYLASSSTNDILDDFRKSEDGTLPIHPVGTLQIEYGDGETLIVDQNAFIDGPPDVSFSTGEETRVWTFICPNAQISARGTNPPPRIGSTG